METLRDEDVEGLAEYYMYANTPLYLLKHFRKHPSVQALALNASGEELVEAFNELIPKPEKALGDIIHLYAYLVALTSKEYSSVYRLLEGLEIPRSGWVADILAVFRATAKPAQSARIDVLHQPTFIAPGGKTGESAGVNTARI